MMKQLFLGFLSLGVLVGVGIGGCDLGESACDAAATKARSCGIEPGNCNKDDQTHVCVARCINLTLPETPEESCTELTALAQAFQRPYRDYLEDLAEYKETVVPRWREEVMNHWREANGLDPIPVPEAGPAPEAGPTPEPGSMPLTLEPLYSDFDLVRWVAGGTGADAGIPASVTNPSPLPPDSGVKLDPVPALPAAPSSPHAEVAITPDFERCLGHCYLTP
jgi:hypothetical protein